MEIVCEKVGYKDKLNNVDLKISSNSVVGIIGKNANIFVEMLLGNITPLVGKMSINKIDLIDNNKDLINKQTAFIKNNDEQSENTILSEIAFVVDKKGYKNSKLNKRISDAFSMVGLNDSFLTRSFNTLSSSERFLARIAIEFICNPKIIIFENPFSNLDYINKKRLIKIIKLLRGKYHKMIFIKDDNVNVLYQFSDEILFIDDCNRIKLYNSYDFFTSTKFLKNNNLDIPILVDITYRGKLKGVKLTYQKDIRDIIKDIYKHV